MAKYTISIMSRDKFREDFNKSLLVKILDKFGFGSTYRSAVAKDMLNDPYVSITEDSITIFEKHTSFTESLKQTAKDTLDCASDSVHYTLNNPAGVARIPYDVLKAIVVNPKVLGPFVLGVAIGTSGCTDQINGADNNKSISDYFGDIVINKENNMTVGDVAAVVNNLDDSKKYRGADTNLVQYTTPDGMVYYARPNGIDGYRNIYDLNGDGSVNAQDGCLSRSDFKTDFDFKLHLKMNWKVPYDSDFYEEYPDFKELRFRSFDLNGNFNSHDLNDQVQLIIDDEVVLTIKNDLNGDGFINMKDIFIQLLK